MTPEEIADLAHLRFIPGHDPDAAIGFYCDALGFEVRNDVAPEMETR